MCIMSEVTENTNNMRINMKNNWNVDRSIQSIGNSLPTMNDDGVNGAIFPLFLSNLQIHTELIMK